MQTLACWRAHRHRHIHTHKTHTYTKAHTHKHLHAGAHTDTHTQTHTTHTYTKAHTHKHAHTHKRAHTHTHTHTHGHTQTYSYTHKPVSGKGINDSACLHHPHAIDLVTGQADRPFQGEHHHLHSHTHTQSQAPVQISATLIPSLPSQPYRKLIAIPATQQQQCNVNLRPSLEKEKKDGWSS
jgi:hypothetical protein